MGERAGKGVRRAGEWAEGLHGLAAACGVVGAWVGVGVVADGWDNGAVVVGVGGAVPGCEGTDQP